eukprot:Gregarina_sp_Poly_1__4142@NODE_2269_length_2378_cov_93_013414_g1455_i0_p2_GENE_NODE_2269_length_2378_cov_93_013414_g1455_i0NODE_2269_length_2378_cov_93_013414_g1455_i0_p2_ORF_typecomplete_len316_score41_56Cyclin_N/PF00134_23/2_3e06_NODE_2269_length_2378_cov_93_013414_g1455_i01371084
MLNHEFIPLLFDDTQEMTPLVEFVDSEGCDKFRNVVPFIRQLRVLLALGSGTEAQGLILYHRWIMSRQLKRELPATTDSSEHGTLWTNHVRKKQKIDSSILQCQVSLYQLGAACLFISGKLSDERRLVRDYANCCLCYLYEKYRSQPEKLREPGNFTNDEAGALPTKKLRKGTWDSSKATPSLKALIDQHANAWETAIVSNELVVLKAFGFMVNSCCQLPHLFVPMIHANIGEKLDALLGQKRQKEVFQRSLTLASDILCLPLCGVYFTALEIAVVCYERAFELVVDVSLGLGSALGMAADRIVKLRQVLHWMLQ